LLSDSSKLGAEPSNQAPPESDKSTSEAPPQAEASPQVARAEEMVDRFAERVASFTSTWGRHLWRVAARVREEAEDIWGEAQSIRRGDQS
jgi:hypothetical protein